MPPECQYAFITFTYFSIAIIEFLHSFCRAITLQSQCFVYFLSAYVCILLYASTALYSRYKLEYYTKLQNEEVYCTKLVKPGERVRRVSSPRFGQAECNKLLRSAPEYCIPFITCHFVISSAVKNAIKPPYQSSPFKRCSMHKNRLTF